MSRRTGVWLSLFVVLAIVARVGVIAYTHATHAAAEENRLIARNLQAGHGFTFTEFGVTGPTAVRGPAYPFLLALIGPDRLWLSLGINTLAGAGTVLAAYALTKRLTVLSPLPVPRGRVREGVCSSSAITEAAEADPHPNPLPEYRERGPDRAALSAAFCFAVWPTQVYAASLTQGLAIAVLLMLSSLALAWRKTPGASIAAGVLAGLAALTEPVLALPLLLSAVVLGRRKNWQNAAVFVVLGCVTVTPWLYRNAIVFGRPMPITSNFWRDAFLGNGPKASGSRLATYQIGSDGEAISPKTRIDFLSPPEYDALKVSEPKRTILFRNTTLDWVNHHTSDYFWLCLNRLWTLIEPAHPYAKNVFVAFSRLYGVTALLCLVAWPDRRKFAAPVLAIALGLIVPTVFVLSDPRDTVLLDVAMLLAVAHVDGSFVHRKPRFL